MKRIAGSYTNPHGEPAAEMRGKQQRCKHGFVRKLGQKYRNKGDDCVLKHAVTNRDAIASGVQARDVAATCHQLCCSRVVHFQQLTCHSQWCALHQLGHSATMPQQGLQLPLQTLVRLTTTQQYRPQRQLKFRQFRRCDQDTQRLHEWQFPEPFAQFQQRHRCAILRATLLDALRATVMRSRQMMSRPLQVQHVRLLPEVALRVKYPRTK